MNQPNAPVITPKVSAPSETPEVLTVVRRYMWLLIFGTLLGVLVSSLLHYYFYRYEPRYTARIPFQIKAPPQPIGSGDAPATVIFNADDTSQIINRQIIILSQDSILLDILNAPSSAFRRDIRSQESDRPSQWYRENSANPLQYLKRGLVVIPKLSAASFEITMTARDRDEAVALLKGIVESYTTYLRNKASSDKSSRQAELNAAVDDATKKYSTASGALQDFSRANGIDALKSQFEIEREGLKAIDVELARAMSIYQAAESNYATIKKQIEATTDLANIKLTPEMELYIENDQSIRTLQYQKLSYEQQLVQIEARSAMGRNSPEYRGVVAMITKVDDQTTENRKRLQSEAVDRMKKQAENESNSRLVVKEEMQKIRNGKQEHVRELSYPLQEFETRQADVNSKLQMLNKLKTQQELSQWSQNTDDRRIQALVDEPATPNEVSWPRWFTFIPLGTIAGLGLSFLLAYGLVITDKRVRTPRDITRTLQMPLLGFVPDQSDDRTLSGEIETAILSSPSSMVAESFRQIRSHITAQTAHNPVNTMLVASISPGGGGTTVAANFAASMALNDLRVLLVDANFYRPTLHKLFKDLPAEGLADALNGGQKVTESIVPHPSLPKLHLLGAGRELAGASSEVFESKAFRELLEQLKSRYDLIIFDGAPLSLVSDSLALAARVDGVISVVRAGEVSRGTVLRIRDQLRGVHANLLGIVLNAAQISNVGYFKENYKKFYRYANQGGRRSSNAE